MSRPDIVYVGEGESLPHVKEAKKLIAENYDRIRADLARFSADTGWVVDNREALKKDYGDMYVAVLGKKVRASHADFSGLLEEIDRKGIDRGNVVTARINRQDVGRLF